jgi:hypothetical protein
LKFFLHLKKKMKFRETSTNTLNMHSEERSKSHGNTIWSIKGRGIASKGSSEDLGSSSACVNSHFHTHFSGLLPRPVEFIVAGGQPTNRATSWPFFPLSCMSRRNIYRSRHIIASRFLRLCWQERNLDTYKAQLN